MISPNGIAHIQLTVRDVALVALSLLWEGEGWVRGERWSCRTRASRLTGLTRPNETADVSNLRATPSPCPLPLSGERVQVCALQRLARLQPGRFRFG